MKKLFALLIVFCAADSLTAQAEPILKSKKGNYILPQTGDWGIGASVNPFFSYLGSMFTTNNTAPVLDFQNVNFKYFLDERNARRAGITIGSNYSRERITVNNLDPDAAAGSTVSDYISHSEIAFNLTYGCEKRRGAGRLQGVYGVEGLLGYGTGNKEKLQYGNSMEFYATSVSNNRPTKIANTPSSFTVGAQAFLGFEYFFAPKISIGGEFYLRAAYTLGGQAVNETEVWDSVEGKSNFIETTQNNRSGDLSFGTVNWSNLRLMFYF